MSDPEKRQSIEPVWDRYMPGIAVDCVIFGYHQHELKILILEYKNSGLFALPGGFIYRDEDLDQAAQRVLQERTSLSDIFLSQFYTFGAYNRHQPEYMRRILKANGSTPDDNHWLLQRFISVGYYAVVNFGEVQPTADELSDSCRWYDLDALPELIQDHKQIVHKALSTMRDNIHQRAVSINLLSETFTMAELRRLHETILDEKLNRSSFHRKMINSGSLERVGKKKTGGAHRAPYLYQFKG